jgi:hypothetical protein
MKKRWQPLLMSCVAQLFLVSICGAAEKKNDILGFFPDMPLEAFREKVTKLDCKDDACKLADGGIIQFKRTQGLPEDHIKQVAYRFKSGLKPHEMIAYVAKQYATKPNVGDIGYAVGRYEDLPLIGRRLMTGGTIATYKTVGMTLILYLEFPGDVLTYVLFLTSDSLDRAEAAAIRAPRDKAAVEAASVNRKPSF